MYTCLEGKKGAKDGQKSLERFLSALFLPRAVCSESKKQSSSRRRRRRCWIKAGGMEESVPRSYFYTHPTLRVNDWLSAEKKRMVSNLNEQEKKQQHHCTHTHLKQVGPGQARPTPTIYANDTHTHTHAGAPKSLWTSLLRSLFVCLASTLASRDSIRIEKPASTGESWLWL